MKRDWRSKQIGRAKTDFPVYLKIPKIRPIQKMKEKAIDFAFSKGGLMITRLLTGLGTPLAGFFQFTENQTAEFVALIGALAGFLIIGLRGRVKSKFVKDYQKENGLEVDAFPGPVTNAHLNGR